MKDQHEHRTKEQLPEAGELYLFNGTHSATPLWGVVDKCCDGLILLESSSEDMLSFRLQHTLPAEYRSCRLATRDELRDYFFALALSEMSMI